MCQIYVCLTKRPQPTRIPGDMNEPAIPKGQLNTLLRTLKNLPAPNEHRRTLPAKVQEVLTEAQETLAGEIQKLSEDLKTRPVTSENYAPIAVRLSATLKDFLKISGADEAADDMKALKAAQISVETFVEKEIRRSELAKEKEERAGVARPAPGKKPFGDADLSFDKDDVSDNTPSPDSDPDDAEFDMSFD